MNIILGLNASLRRFWINQMYEFFSAAVQQLKRKNVIFPSQDFVPKKSRQQSLDLSGQGLWNDTVQPTYYILQTTLLVRYQIFTSSESFPSLDAVKLVKGALNLIHRGGRNICSGLGGSKFNFSYLTSYTNTSQIIFWRKKFLKKYFSDT